VETRPWQGNKNCCCNAPKKIYLTKICGTYIETGALGTIDNQIVRKWAGVFSSTYDRVVRHFMKTSFYILTLFILTTCQNVFGQQSKLDTIFIRKDSLKGVSQSIFFETNKNSKFYENITSFKFGMFDKESYDESLDYLKKNKIKLKKQKTISLSKKWITLKLYSGQFYAYYPCDFYSFYQVSVNDSTYIDWTGEGPIANKIISQKKLNDTTFEIKVTGILEQDRTITINIIDKTRGIAVFTEETVQNGKNQFLMIMADKIKTVPFIVNNCETSKQSELKFEEPNFDKLLKQK
jgi:hypothetical protein